MGYQLKEGESHMVHCFECKEAFELTSEHEKNYIDSSMCPVCFNKAMEFLHGGPIEYYQQKIMKSLDMIIEDIKGINQCIQDILDEHKKGGK